MQELIKKMRTAGKIRKNRNEIEAILNEGRLRQILERGYLSHNEIQFVVDAVSEKLYAKND